MEQLLEDDSFAQIVIIVVGFLTLLINSFIGRKRAKKQADYNMTQLHLDIIRLKIRQAIILEEPTDVILNYLYEYKRLGGSGDTAKLAEKYITQKSSHKE